MRDDLHDRPTARSILRSWVESALAFTTLALCLFLIDQQIVQSIGALDLGLWWWERAVVFYSSISLILAGLEWSLTRGASPRRVTSAFRIGLILIAPILLASNYKVLSRLIDAGDSTRARFVLALVAATFAFLLTGTRFSPVRTIRSTFALASALLLFSGLHNQAPSSAASAELRRSIEPDPTPRPELFVLGIDGADWHLIEVMFERGEMPNLARLRQRSAWGPLETIQPTLSPLVWTTMITGRSPEEHGVLRLDVRRPRGFEIGAQGRGIRVRAAGLSQLQSLLARAGQLVRGPVTGSERRVPALWNIVSAAGRSISVVSWWATWPAEPVLGRIVSDRVYYDRAWARGANDSPTERLTFPQSLAPRMRRLVVRPGDVDFSRASEYLDVSPEEYEGYLKLPYSHHDVRSEIRLYLSMFASDEAFVRELLREDRTSGKSSQIYLALVRIVDLTSHCCLKYSNLVADHVDSTPEQLQRFSRVTEEAYRKVDELIGEIVERFPGANIVLLSDHGFRLEQVNGQNARYDHDTAPPGIFLGAGPAFRPGRIEGMSVYDVMPTLLYLQGLPDAANMRGKLFEPALDPELLRLERPREIPSYDFVPVPRGRAAAFRSDQEILEEFRALGYIN